MLTAFKEWSVVVDALGQGRQILITRKGGIHEKGDFRPEHREFLLFPTLFHQHRAGIIAAAHDRCDEIASRAVPEQITIGFFARTVAHWHPETPDFIPAIAGQHIWRDELLRERFEAGKIFGIHVLAVRVFRLAQPVTLPMRPAYGGCKSWIGLEENIPVANATPVLADQDFASHLAALQTALGKRTA